MKRSVLHYELLANGVDVKTVQTRLGHANASITLNWYAHAVPENDQRATQLIGDPLSSNSQSDASEEPRANELICTDLSKPTCYKANRPDGLTI
ncbi:tyrosine-type recombinase/integrase [Ellagibacter isourolithinifaciens]|uniref:tyrosine-type recombinase/integrase n=1 Tax=Ellagibacter isourolithinifaciens TaxID=2137581 RepID=UPI003AF14B68